MEHYYKKDNTQSTWKIITKLPHCQIWQHKLSHTIAQAYPIQNYQTTHARINRNKKHIVHSLGCVFDAQAGCTFLLIERVPNRFSEVMTLNQSQTLKVLYATFMGLDELYDTYGFVEITQSCICFNEDGKVKIWVNSDLSSLHPVKLLSGQVKPTQIMKSIVRMVEAKCFNSSFLKRFIKKLEMDQVSSFGQAGKEILKIGQLLFLDIQERSMQGYSSQDISYCSNQILRPVNININLVQQLKTQQITQNREIPRKAVIINHSRRLSNQSVNQIKDYQSYESFLNSQKSYPQLNLIQTPLHLTKLNNNSKSQTITTNQHRSAPLSPRDNSGAQKNNKSSNSQNINQIPFQKFVKKPREITLSNQSKKLRMDGKGIIHIPKNLNFIKRNCPPITEDSKSDDDSFSQNLKIQEKEIFVSGQFQTFGILEDLDENAPRSPKFNQILESSLTNEENQMKTALDFNVYEMDKQIQKKLELKANKQREKKNAYFNKSTNYLSPYEIRTKQTSNASTTIHQNQLQGIASFQRSKSRTLYQPKQRQKQNEKLKAYGGLTQFFSGISQIDKKYEDFLSIGKLDPLKTAQPQKKQEIEYNIKHSKHIRNVERISEIGNPKYQKFGIFTISTTKYLPCIPSISENFKHTSISIIKSNFH